MSNPVTISANQIDRLENEMRSIKTLLRRILEQLQSPIANETLQSRRDVVATMDTAAQRANLTEAAAADLITDAIKEVRRQHPNL